MGFRVGDSRQGFAAHRGSEGEAAEEKEKEENGETGSGWDFGSLEVESQEEREWSVSQEEGFGLESDLDLGLMYWPVI